MDKQLFDDAIGEVPPSTVDVDAVIVRGRRAARLRRVTHPTVAAGVAVVLLTGVVAYSMTPADDRDVTVGTAPPSSRPSTAHPSGPDPADTVTSIPTPVLPPRCEEGDLDTVAEAAVRLTQAATNAVREQRPDVQLVANATFPAGTPRGPLEFYQTVEPAYPDVSVCDVRATLHAWATARTPLGDGNIGFETSPAFFPTLNPPCKAKDTPDRIDCAELTGPHGEKILTEAFEYERGTRKHQVRIIRADGTSLRIHSENVATTGGSDGPTTPAPPFTVEQLIAIGADPALTLFP
ncbi:hypothetical protein ADK67_34145 [Saccharothrix sp. NRRL B-16348]|uniref:hypothetical protein n=1 Tax=Saccharothrix sp. NRRL B-16348 TaxID=1415542 RepID=UPI0006AE35AA|nr:hypothetical protein [Saccharothrix sp. NRRL B-16348]KOX19194.1 hypothetical protein ADK67_34145 [Saccharothrix sp. NRRL B-16348]